MGLVAKATSRSRTTPPNAPGREADRSGSLMPAGLPSVSHCSRQLTATGPGAAGFQPANLGWHRRSARVGASAGSPALPTATAG